MKKQLGFLVTMVLGFGFLVGGISVASASTVTPLACVAEPGTPQQFGSWVRAYNIVSGCSNTRTSWGGIKRHRTLLPDADLANSFYSNGKGNYRRLVEGLCDGNGTHFAWIKSPGSGGTTKQSVRRNMC